jgi:hypothetical protein
MSEEKTITHKCPNRSCNQIMTVKKPDGIFICGIPLSVCKTCEQAGYSCQSGMGNGKVYIYLEGKLVDEYRQF